MERKPVLGWYPGPMNADIFGQAQLGFFSFLLLFTFKKLTVGGMLHDDNFIKAARPAKAAKPPDNFYFVL